MNCKNGEFWVLDLNDKTGKYELASKLEPDILEKQSDSYGGKASKLAFLAHPKIAGMGGNLQKKYPQRLTPTGFVLIKSKYASANESEKPAFCSSLVRPAYSCLYSCLEKISAETNKSEKLLTFKIPCFNGFDSCITNSIIFSGVSVRFCRN